MTDSTARITHLSLVAHELALQRGTLTPAERPDFFHLPMWRVNGIPVLDATRMGEDQIQEALEVLERLTGLRNAQNTFEQVRDYMLAYGRFGIRRMDVADA